MVNGSRFFILQKSKVTNWLTARKQIIMKSFKMAFRLGVFTTITVVGTAYYFLKKKNVTAGTLLDNSIESLEKAAIKANAAFKDAQASAHKRTRKAFKNVNQHFEMLKADVEEGVEIIDSEIRDVAQDIKNNVE